MPDLPQQHEAIFELGDLRLRLDATLRNAKLAYKTHGQLNATKRSAILYPTHFAAQHGDVEWLIGSGRALDPDKNFIVVLDQRKRIVVAEQHSTTARSLSLSDHHHSR